MLLTPPPLPKAILFSPHFRSYQETKMAVPGRTERSTSLISRKNRGLWTVYVPCGQAPFRLGFRTTVAECGLGQGVWWGEWGRPTALSSLTRLCYVYVLLRHRPSFARQMYFLFHCRMQVNHDVAPLRFFFCFSLKTNMHIFTCKDFAAKIPLYCSQGLATLIQIFLIRCGFLIFNSGE